MFYVPARKYDKNICTTLDNPAWILVLTENQCSEFSRSITKAERAHSNKGKYPTWYFESQQFSQRLPMVSHNRDRPAPRRERAAHTTCPLQGRREWTDNEKLFTESMNVIGPFDSVQPSPWSARIRPFHGNGWLFPHLKK
ncbi:hypothetical protein EVAR_57654_1 [Eumeta japonica]|uniref:Uncharacterized protein n=1 Tax=Eumeta variegata TaxID=151549 RepID=A0A4C1YYQ6_EUMVA|nr:hypothetical protein EVAR_57654_1 [Eumeta japonica]